MDIQSFDREYAQLVTNAMKTKQQAATQIKEKNKNNRNKKKKKKREEKKKKKVRLDSPAADLERDEGISAQEEKIAKERLKRKRRIHAGQTGEGAQNIDQIRVRAAECTFKAGAQVGR